MEQEVNTPQEPRKEIYFPELDKKPDFLKIALIVAGALLLLYLIINISTKKETIQDNSYIKAQIDSLAKVNDSLKRKQAKLDSVSYEYQIQIDNLDWKVQNVGEKKTVIREYYHDRVKEPATYNPHQLDSFFKNRYSY